MTALIADDELLRAIVSGQTYQALAILRGPGIGDSSVNFRDPDGWTPLFYACSKGQYELTKELLRCGASANSAADNDGATALHICASAQPSQTGADDFLSTAAVVMHHGGNPYQENAAGVTPVMMAAKQGNTEMKMLLESCALFRGSLTFRTNRLFGERLADRYCFLQPRYGWNRGSEENEAMISGFPAFELVCYKDKADAEPKTVIPLPVSMNPEVQTKEPTTGEALLIADSIPKDMKPKMHGKRFGLAFKASSQQTLSSERVLELLAFIFVCMEQGKHADGLGFLCKAGYSWAMKQHGLPEGLTALPQDELASDRIGHGEEAIGNGNVAAEGKQDRRSSLNFSQLGKAIARRMSISEKPSRRSMTKEDARRSKTFARQATPETISEEPLSEAHFQAKKSTGASPNSRASQTFGEKWKDKINRRLSIGGRRSIDLRQGGSSVLKSRRHAAMQAQKIFISSLPDQPAEALQFWQRLHTELRKSTQADSSAARPGSQASDQTQASAALSHKVHGGQALEARFKPLTNSATGERIVRNNARHTTQDVGHLSSQRMRGDNLDWSHRASIPEESYGELPSTPTRSPGLNPHLLRPLAETDFGGPFGGDSALMGQTNFSPGMKSTTSRGSYASRLSSRNLSISEMEGLSTFNKAVITLDSDTPQLATPPSMQGRPVDTESSLGLFLSSGTPDVELPFSPGSLVDQKPGSGQNSTPSRIQTPDSAPPPVRRALYPVNSGEEEREIGILNTTTIRPSPFANVTAVFTDGTEGDDDSGQVEKSSLPDAAIPQSDQSPAQPSSTHPSGLVTFEASQKEAEGTGPSPETAAASHIPESHNAAEANANVLTAQGQKKQRLHQATNNDLLDELSNGPFGSAHNYLDEVRKLQPRSPRPEDDPLYQGQSWPDSAVNETFLASVEGAAAESRMSPNHSPRQGLTPNAQLQLQISTAQSLREMLESRRTEIEAIQKRAVTEHPEEENRLSNNVSSQTARKKNNRLDFAIPEDAVVPEKVTNAAPGQNHRPRQSKAAVPVTRNSAANDPWQGLGPFREDFQSHVQNPELYETQLSLVETYLDSSDQIHMDATSMASITAPNTSLASLLRQVPDREQTSAPAPMLQTKFSNAVMFTSEIESADDVFVWSLRPRQYRSSAPAHPAAAGKTRGKNVAYTQLASQAAQLLEADRKMLEEALQDLQNPAKPPTPRNSQDWLEPAKILRQPSGEAIPEV